MREYQASLTNVSNLFFSSLFSRSGWGFCPLAAEGGVEVDEEAEVDMI